MKKCGKCAMGNALLAGALSGISITGSVVAKDAKAAVLQELECLMDTAVDGKLTREAVLHAMENSLEAGYIFAGIERGAGLLLGGATRNVMEAVA